ncbi:hypothetical protein ACLB2K_010600 [Fragaria x ananassa]
MAKKLVVVFLILVVFVVAAVQIREAEATSGLDVFVWTDAPSSKNTKRDSTVNELKQTQSCDERFMDWRRLYSSENSSIPYSIIYLTKCVAIID